MALVRREMWRSVMAPLTRPLMNLHSAILVLTVMNFHHGLLAILELLQTFCAIKFKRVRVSLCLSSAPSSIWEARRFANLSSQVVF